MTEILRAFWKEKRPERIAVLVSGILFAVIFWIYEIPVEIAGYAFLLVILWNVIWFTLVFIRYEKRQRILEENQGKIRTEAGGFPEAESRESEMYQELIQQLTNRKKSWNPLCRLKNRSCLIITACGFIRSRLQLQHLVS